MTTTTGHWTNGRHPFAVVLKAMAATRSIRRRPARKAAEWLCEERSRALPGGYRSAFLRPRAPGKAADTYAQVQRFFLSGARTQDLRLPVQRLRVYRCISITNRTVIHTI
ncbi:hypothetical protein [Streptomyces sioyaensis]|uniref:hypothetical protein n=1 Tax=Streptomyces sioyaensis TaxID=67364 RepID=UPI003D71DF97